MPRGLIAAILALAAAPLPAAEPQIADFDRESLIATLGELGQALERAVPPAEARRLKAAISAGDAAAADVLLSRHSAIQVSINPETRVTAEALSLPARACPEDSPWIVRVVNDGFATSSLRVIGTPPHLAQVRLSGTRLSGARVEYRLLQVSIPEGGPLEILASFSAGRSTSDLGGRATLPLLLTCRR
jgi:hypothetical protein